MSIVTPPASGSGYINAEMARAYEDAVRAVRSERQQPDHLRRARSKALLRWLADTDKG